MRILLTITLGWGLGWFLQPYCYETLSEATHNFVPESIDYRETFRSITDPFMLKLKLAFYIGLVFALPFCVFEIWKFVAPGLRKHEKKYIKYLIPVSVVLFGVGVFCCWLILPSAFGWLVGFASEFSNTAVYQEPGTLLFFTLKMMLAFGLGFQLPVLVFCAAKLGLITPAALLRYWRHVVVAIFIMSMLFVPSADPMSLLMLAVPLSLLFFLSVAVVRLTTPKSKRALKNS
jgi:sec-independent protein translocase protein TatC